MVVQKAVAGEKVQVIEMVALPDIAQRILLFPLALISRKTLNVLLPHLLACAIIDNIERKIVVWRKLFD